ncbi:family 20 glycosylhydrolase (plasmid) [Hymenobacter tibetensis]|uniref:beta-N-acetylhexosaminidase n=1 Tax=Hymenobacter tibetensis TaxID=497967 RepID=A0ABY4D5F0_9BACT|nr:family 20 glycosylhydrolase [Hymenobacter tibetensis]UOG77506.1 family 20 glycosylhydrolase [Hymenobacter tibetensis]
MLFTLTLKARVCGLLATGLLASQVALAQSTEIPAQSLGLVPLPREVKAYAATYALPQKISVYAASPAERNVATLLQGMLTSLGKTVTLTTNRQAAQIVLATAAATSPEAYQLVVDKAGIKITAAGGPGLFYGTQTLLQLLPPRAAATAKVPYVRISDQPAFQWRGGMLDVCRHFFPVSFVKKYIDFLAAYKMNTFHWHLTDDQGWRIEIKKYPKLTEISAFRSETLLGAQQQMKTPADFKYDGTPYGGFYTQEQIKDVIAYAQKRYVTIVPEIEMPGHSVAILAAYPELACKPGPYQTWTKWGVNEDIVCPTEPTFRFFEDVLTEVSALFPGKYIHIGGDEAPKARWKESAAVQEIMKREGFTDVEKVQGWFNRRIEKFLQSKGKKLIGWDEILEGGIAPSAAVMSWRGEKGGIEAAQHGHDVVMTPTTNLYLDYGQNPQPHSPYEPLMIGGYLPLAKVYSYNPLPKELTPEQQKHIMGVGANMWTEYITTPEKAEYMLFPRFLAAAEVAWTPAALKSYEAFLPRMGQQFARLDAKKINYRVPEPLGLDSATVVKQGNKAVLTLRTLVPGSQIRYTLDGKMPDETTDLYTKPFTVPQNRQITVRAVTVAPNGRKSPPVQLLIN